MNKKFNFSQNIELSPKINYPKNISQLKKILRGNNFSFLGNGRSYGDMALNKSRMVSSKNFNKILEFNKSKGTLIIESGALLSDILPIIIKDGWFIPTTPGTKFVSFGGMVANNIHGKNIKKNSIKSYIKNITIILPNTKIVQCSPLINKEIFDLTVGGFGLTGMILSVKIKLKKIESNKIIQEISEFNSYNEVVHSINLNKNYEYNVAWVSNFNNKNISGLSFKGRHEKEKTRNILDFKYKVKKMNIIIFLILYLKVRLKYLNIFTNYIYKKYNKFFYTKEIDINKFFYPQDAFINWNIIYGEKGFFQIQILFKKKNFKKIMSEIYFFLKKNELFSSFIVIKKYNENGKYLNFSGEGISLSMDFRINYKFNLLKVFFNNLIEKYSLKVNFSKDLITENYNTIQYKEFKLFKKKINRLNKGKINSIFSNRVKIT